VLAVGGAGVGGVVAVSVAVGAGVGGVVAVCARDGAGVGAPVAVTAEEGVGAGAGGFVGAGLEDGAGLRSGALGAALQARRPQTLSAATTWAPDMSEVFIGMIKTCLSLARRP
jgi:hypothetical protein